jgi:hypothetical protein
MKPLFLFLFLFFAVVSEAQQKDSVFILKCVLAGNSEALPYCPVTVMKSGTWFKTNADSSGFVILSARQFRDSAFFAEVVYPFRKHLLVKLSSLKMNDTNFLVVNNDPVVLNEIELDEYLVPEIDKSHKKKNIFIPDTIYSADTMAMVEKLGRGEWKFADTSRGKFTGETDWSRYLRKTLTYPAAAYANKISGKIYMDFTLDENGKVNGLKLAYGKDPALVLEVANALANMPPLRNTQQEYISIIDNPDEGEGIRSTTRLIKAKPPVYRLCVNFRLL